MGPFWGPIWQRSEITTILKHISTSLVWSGSRGSPGAAAPWIQIGIHIEIQIQIGIHVEILTCGLQTECSHFAWFHLELVDPHLLGVVGVSGLPRGRAPPPQRIVSGLGGCPPLLGEGEEFRVLLLLHPHGLAALLGLQPVRIRARPAQPRRDGVLPQHLSSASRVRLGSRTKNP